MRMLMYGYTQLYFQNARTFQTFASRILKKIFSQIAQYTQAFLLQVVSSLWRWF